MNVDHTTEPVPCVNWADLPDGVAAAVLHACVASGSTKAARLVCRHWRSAVDAAVRSVELVVWPAPGATRPLSVALPHVESVALVGHSMADAIGGQLDALLADLANLTGITSLQLRSEALCTVTRLQLPDAGGHGRGYSICLPAAVAQLQRLQRLDITHDGQPGGQPWGDFGDASCYELPPVLPPSLTELMLTGTVPARRHLTNLTALRSLSLYGWRPATQMAVHLHKLPALTQLTIDVVPPSSYHEEVVAAGNRQLAGAIYGELLRCVELAQVDADGQLPEQEATQKLAEPSRSCPASLALRLQHRGPAPPQELCAALAPTLTALDLSHNLLADLPPQLSLLTGLQLLKLADNSLQALPDCVLQLVALTSLDVSANSIAALPRGMSRLTRLQELLLCTNRAEQACRVAPGVLAGLGALTRLEFADCSLCGLPGELGSTNLRALDVSMNKLATLPANLSAITALTHLSIGCNHFGPEPLHLTALSALRKLCVSGTSTKQPWLPGQEAPGCPFKPVLLPGRGQLGSLRELDASWLGRAQAELLLWEGGGASAAAPAGAAAAAGAPAAAAAAAAPTSGAIGKPAAFASTLSPAAAAAAAAPEPLAPATSPSTAAAAAAAVPLLQDAAGRRAGWLCGLKLLTRLDLTGNKLMLLPDEIGHMTALEELYVKQNQLASLPEAFSRLMNLRVLDATSNRLQRLPGGLDRLMALEELQLSQNLLQVLPPGLHMLMELQTLNLAANELQSLPAELAHMPALHALDICFNQPLAALPPGLSAALCLSDVTLDLRLRDEPEARALAQRHGVVVRLMAAPHGGLGEALARAWRDGVSIFPES